MELLQRQIQFCQTNYLVFNLENKDTVRTSYLALMDRFTIYPSDSDQYSDIVTFEELVGMIDGEKSPSKISSVDVYGDTSMSPPFEHPLLGSWEDTDRSSSIQTLLTDYMEHSKPLFAD